MAWLAALNDVRLVLGVRLAVTEEATPADIRRRSRDRGRLRAVPGTSPCSRSTS
jgi:hypothetical protein